MEIRSFFFLALCSFVASDDQLVRKARNYPGYQAYQPQYGPYANNYPYQTNQFPGAATGPFRFVPSTFGQSYPLVPDPKGYPFIGQTPTYGVRPTSGLGPSMVQPLPAPYPYQQYFQSMNQLDPNLYPHIKTEIIDVEEQDFQAKFKNGLPPGYTIQPIPTLGQYAQPFYGFNPTFNSGYNPGSNLPGGNSGYLPGLNYPGYNGQNSGSYPGSNTGPNFAEVNNQIQHYNASTFEPIVKSTVFSQPLKATITRVIDPNNVSKPVVDVKYNDIEHKNIAIEVDSKLADEEKEKDESEESNDINSEPEDPEPPAVTSWFG